jgi:hypothetical protein
MKWCVGCKIKKATSQCQCKTAIYCGEKCQVKHWDTSHKYDCISAGVKREREDVFPMDPPSFDPDTQVLLESADSKYFVVSIEDAKTSLTIQSLIEDSGTTRAIPIPNIESSVLYFITEYMKTKDNMLFVDVTYSTIIQLIMAANYLDMRNLLKILTRPFRKNVPQKANYELEKIIINYAYDDPKNNSFVYIYEHAKNLEDTEFTERELQLINDNPDSSLLDEIRVLTIRQSPQNLSQFRLLDIPKDIIASFILPRANFTNVNYISYHWFPTLMRFRKMHRYFWHVTTQFIIRTFRTRFAEETQELTDSQVFDCVVRFVKTHEMTLVNFALTAKDILPDTIKNISLMRIIVIALKKHGSFENMDAIVARKRASATKAKETKKANVEKQKQSEESKRKNIDANRRAIANYLDSLGYYVNLYGLPEVSDYVIEDFENDEIVKNILQKIKDQVQKILTTEPIDFNSLRRTIVRPEKWKMILFTIDRQKMQETDLYFQKLQEFLLQNGYNIGTSQLKQNLDRQKPELEEAKVKMLELFTRRITIEKIGFRAAMMYTTPKKFEELLSLYKISAMEESEKCAAVQNKLKNLGFVVDCDDIIANEYNIDAIIGNITSSTNLDFIRNSTVSWEKFIEVVNKNF